jgi:hypothetical protein
MPESATATAATGNFFDVVDIESFPALRTWAE